MKLQVTVTVEFVPLPPEKEEAYWAAIHVLSEIMFADLIAQTDPPPLVETAGGHEATQADSDFSMR